MAASVLASDCARELAAGLLIGEKGIGPIPHAMPRAARIAPGDMVFHILNRANRRARIFGHPGDYDAFERVVGRTLECVPMRILSYCVMPSHWLCAAAHNQCYVEH